MLWNRKSRVEEECEKELKFNKYDSLDYVVGKHMGNPEEYYDDWDIKIPYRFSISTLVVVLFVLVFSFMPAMYINQILYPRSISYNTAQEIVGRSTYEGSRVSNIKVSVVESDLEEDYASQVIKDIDGSIIGISFFDKPVIENVIIPEKESSIKYWWY